MKHLRQGQSIDNLPKPTPDWPTPFGSHKNGSQKCEGEAEAKPPQRFKFVYSESLVLSVREILQFELDL